MNTRWWTLIVSFGLLAWTAAGADDGEKVLKSMSRNAKVTVNPEEVGVLVSESEHAFIDMMKFYVPAQAASGDPALVDYTNADGLTLESLGVAKPLVGVFIHGPAIGVDGTAFAHSFMDAYAAVSLDDGMTWKTTNLSESADLSSFILGQDGGGGGDGGGHELPADHNQLEKDDGVIAFHADGMDYPYTNECTDCHGYTLQGAEGPSCYSCHGPEWDEDAPDGITVIYIEKAVWKDKKDKGKLEVEGEIEGIDYNTEITLINGVTDAILATETVDRDGEFEFDLKLEEIPPCTVAIIADGVKSVVVPVVNDKGDDSDSDSDSDGETLEVCEGEPIDLTDYPGGAYNIFHATAGNKVLVAWPSRYCQQGKPAYTLSNEENATDLANLVSFFQTGTAADENHAMALPDFSMANDLYLLDAFGVAGSQGSIDFADEGYPQAGEVPFGCVWTSRGILLAGDDPRTGGEESSYMVWTKPERLTSGRRDPFRIEVKAVQGTKGTMEGGFAVTWQEDPEGLRPGQGYGPGEGWSGAVAHHQTDVWYSFINWEYFDYVDDDAGGAINIVNHDLTVSGTPQVFVPMAVPMRLTNNAKCKVDSAGNVEDTKLYCHHEPYDYDGGIFAAADYGLKVQCANTVDILTGPNDAQTPICVSEDGLPNVANTAATRPRLSLQKSESGSAWVIVAAEESKGLGAFFFLPNGMPCEEGSSDDCQEEIGKNQWYFSFDMGTPDTSAGALIESSLVRNLVNQGNMLNQPEVDWRTGEFYDAINTSTTWQFGTYDFDIYNTEIARRASLLVQSVAKARASESKLLATPSWKQGPMRQGGPADTMMRRIVYDPDATSTDPYANPYAFTNMECAAKFPASAYYPDGVCMDPATNLSSVVPDTCIDTTTGVEGCPTVTFGTSTFGIGDTNPILQGFTQGEGNTQKVLTWHQCPSDGAQTEGSDFTAVTCDNDTRTDDFANLKDQSWYNPLDISKGHRGFIDGDRVMFLYAWSPNWRLNAKGSDRYELYVRRSFDGGVSWTTTPNVGVASDGITPYGGNGTVTCETYRSTETGSGGIEEPRVCYEYPPFGAEQARNITQHSAMRTTTLDPRYAATAPSIELGCVDANDVTIDIGVMTCDDTSGYDSDLRNPSRFFMVFETGDNSTVAEGEAEPLDLFYSRAINFGDDYVVWADEVMDSTLTECYPSDPHGDEVPAALVGSGFCNEFDRMNAGGDTHSSEANLESNPDGSKLYGVWAQWAFDELGLEVDESDAMARRLWWVDGFVPADAWDFGQGTGDGEPVN